MRYLSVGLSKKGYEKTGRFLGALFFTFLGTVFSLGPVLAFSDLMILGMAFPNILGVVWLAPKVKAALDDYWARYQSGAMQGVIGDASEVNPQPAEIFSKEKV